MFTFTNPGRRTLAACLLLAVAAGAFAQQAPAPLRPPAVPLVTHDPYFSVWSGNSNLADDRTRHWTGAPNGMVGMLRIDGKPYHFMGQSYSPLPPPMKQVSLEVLPTRTLYQFEAEGVRLTLTFMSPLLAEDLDVMSRPATYLTFDARAVDGRAHKVSVYFDVTAEWAVNTTYQKVIWSRPKVGDLDVLSFGSQQQSILEQAGDDLRIDWGYLYLVVPPGDESSVIAWNQTARNSFAKEGTLPDSDDLRMPRPARDQLPAAAVVMDLGAVGASTVSRHVVVAYDDQFSIEYFNRRLRPYGRRDSVSTRRSRMLTACRSTTARRTPSWTGSCGRRRSRNQRKISAPFSAPFTASSTRRPTGSRSQTGTGPRTPSSAAFRRAPSSAACTLRCSLIQLCGRSGAAGRADS
jgi:hypothetical protein